MRTLATFSVDGRVFGVEVTRVREVTRSGEVTPVPLAPEAVAGLMNLRGQIVTALDLRTRLGLPERAPQERPMHVLVDGPGGTVSLQVDRVGDVQAVDDASVERPSATLHGQARDLIVGTHALEGALVLELDLDRTIDVLRKDEGDRP